MKTKHFLFITFLLLLFTPNLSAQTQAEMNQTAYKDFQKADTQDWNAEWKKHYKAIPVHAELCIVPAWEKNASSSDRDLFINPGMGFGTGSHETTFLCLKLYLLEEILYYKNSNEL